jgi:hypothetical protein
LVNEFNSVLKELCIHHVRYGEEKLMIMIKDYESSSLLIVLTHLMNLEVIMIMQFKNRVVNDDPM